MSEMSKEITNKITELSDDQLTNATGGKVLAGSASTKSGQNVSNGLGLPGWMDPIVSKISDLVNKK